MRDTEGVPEEEEEQKVSQLVLERAYLTAQTKLATTLRRALALFEGRMILDIAPDYDPEEE